MRRFLLPFVLLTLAFPLFGEDVSSDPDYENGYELYNQARYDEALPLFKKVIEKDAKNVKAQVYYGVCWMGKEDFEKAIPELDKALKMDEKLPLAHYALAVSYARKNPPDVSKAEACMKSAKSYGYQVPVWFEQYVDRLKKGPLVPSPQTASPEASKNNPS